MNEEFGIELEFDETKQYCESPRPLVLTTRWFRRSAPLGMKVWRSVTRNFDCGHEIEHIEIACPNYKLTDRGPVIERKKETEDE